MFHSRITVKVIRIDLIFDIKIKISINIVFIPIIRLKMLLRVV